MTTSSVYPIENHNWRMGGNSNFARPMLPTYRGSTVPLNNLYLIEYLNEEDKLLSFEDFIMSLNQSTRHWVVCTSATILDTKLVVKHMKYL